MGRHGMSPYATVSWRLRGGAAFVIAFLVVSVVGRPAGAETLEEALADAYLINPVLNAERARLRATDEQVALAKSGLRPFVSGSADTSCGVAIGTGSPVSVAPPKAAVHEPDVG